MRITCLCDRPQRIAEVAAAHVAAFGQLLPEWTQVQAEQELRQHQCDAIPVTWLAEDADGWLGSISLLHEDHADVPSYSPWLASLYVQPSARGRGIARALVNHCVAEAARRGIARLYLYCDAPMLAFYQRQGWQVEARLPLGPLWIVILFIQPPKAG
ncbi:GNAT family N-acetyltransferase [Stenotrophomonas sp. YIM B06876]|uniref:GNAT family N-acetyltransferase n=1 Tax=Stenotrophomonas sp. YIM B06876 TaxID=3060211 RepID=UPI002739B335|nr:GNAT family N-acetyltransferase [Stenotrophomonas sp. YIM B06876]